MLQNLKALVVVLLVSLPAYWLLWGWAKQFVTRKDYVRRCGVWTAITVLAFLVPNYWLYCLFSLPLMYWAGKADRNPVALVLFLLHVVPPVGVELPVVGINRLFEVNHYYWMTLLILVPALMRQTAPNRRTPGVVKIADAGVLGYLALTVGSLAVYTTFTDVMRNVVVQFVDVFLAYYAFTRLDLDRKRLREVFACAAIAAAPIALVGVWEWARHWLLYADLYTLWGRGDIAELAYLWRGGMLRAQSSTGHSMTLSYLMAIAFAFWLGAMDWQRLSWRSIFLALVIVAGCLVSIARGGWVVAALVYLVFLVIGPLGAARVYRQIAVLAVVAVVVVMQPGGEKFIDMLPFIGSDTVTIDYRARLAQLSWRLVWQNPWLGDPFVLKHMESMRQGQGIIDLVNVYATVALFNGFVGLVLFLLPVGAAIVVALHTAFKMRRKDPPLNALAAALGAALLGTLAMFTVGSFGGGLSYFYWALIGLAVGLSRTSVQLPTQEVTMDGKHWTVRGAFSRPSGHRHAVR
jgi:hypothetical protein